jgi:hypothetical protein
MRTSSIIYKNYIEMRKGMGQSGQQLFTSNEKVWKAEMTNLVICSGYNAPTLL